MPPPQKHYRAINYHDTHYRWIMQNQRGFNELRIEASAAVNGQTLVAELPRIVNDSMISDAIDFALTNGWQPNTPGPDFRCIRRRHGFEKVVN